MSPLPEQLRVMKPSNFYLLVDSSLICSYLVSQWIETFVNFPGFQGILVKEKAPSESMLEARKAFHSEYCSQRNIVDQAHRILVELYPELDRTEYAMIKNYGIAAYPTSGCLKTIFLGNNVNGIYAQEWLKSASEESPPFVFVCASQILKPWWIEMTKSRLFNCHTAVLPYARGMYAIENMAIIEDIDRFKEAAGITIHYVNQGVDTGAIIRAQRILDPFQFDSIWDLKAYSYILEFDLYTKTAKDILLDPQTLPAGIISDPKLQGPNFRINQFTLEKQAQAEQSYCLMKRQETQ